MSNTCKLLLAVTAHADAHAFMSKLQNIQTNYKILPAMQRYFSTATESGGKREKLLVYGNQPPVTAENVQRHSLV